jgi:hypothetical protein
MHMFLASSMPLAWLMCLCANAQIDRESEQRSAEVLSAWSKRFQDAEARGGTILYEATLYEADADRSYRAAVQAAEAALRPEHNRKAGFIHFVALKAWSDKLEAAAARGDRGAVAGIVRRAEQSVEVDAGSKEGMMARLRDQEAKIMGGQSRRGHLDEMAAVESAAR